MESFGHIEHRYTVEKSNSSDRDGFTAMQSEGTPAPLTVVSYITTRLEAMGGIFLLPLRISIACGIRIPGWYLHNTKDEDDEQTKHT